MKRLPPALLVTLAMTGVSPGAEALDPASIRTAHARFVQKKETPLLREPLRSSGEMWVDRGGRITWVVEAPEPLRVVLRSDGAFVDGRRLEDAPPIGAALLQRFGDLLTGDFEALGGDFEVREVEHGASLTPRAPNLRRWVFSIELMLAPGSTLPTTIRISEADGSRTSIELQNVVANPPIPEGAFDP